MLAYLTGEGRQMVILSVVIPHKTHDLAENYDLIHYNGLKGVVFRLKAEMTVFFIKPF